MRFCADDVRLCARRSARFCEGIRCFGAISGDFIQRPERMRHARVEGVFLPPTIDLDLKERFSSTQQVCGLYLWGSWRARKRDRRLSRGVRKIEDGGWFVNLFSTEMLPPLKGTK